MNGNLLKLQLDCETAILLVTQCLRENGLRVVRSFDLRSACASFTDNICPHHGTSPCDCQLVVLLVVDQQSLPATLIVHGNSLQTEFEFDDGPENRPSLALENYIRRSLAVEALVLF